MKPLSLLILVLLLSSCVSHKDLTRKKYTFFNHESEKVNYRIEVPKKFSDEKIIVGGHGKEYQYWYPDSSVVYISSDEQSASLNEENIANQEGANSKRHMAWAENKDLVLEGKKDGLYWKEIILGEGIKLGYRGVREERKVLFDKAVQSFSLKK